MDTTWLFYGVSRALVTQVDFLAPTGRVEFVEQGAPQLYDLSKDLGERESLAQKHLERVSQTPRPPKKP